MTDYRNNYKRVFHSNGRIPFVMIEVPGGDYMLGETPVTQELWESLMPKNPSHFSNKPDHPVEQVSFNDALSLIGKLNEFTSMSFRLPTEKEWEYAARGGSKSLNYIYPGSNDLDEVAWYLYNSKKRTHAVKGKLPNEIGLYDMMGNVWEWNADETDVPVSMFYRLTLKQPPQGIETYKERVLKGGSCMNGPHTSLITNINHFPDSYRNFHIGFRLALSLP